jgi:hypothetical protein
MTASARYGLHADGHPAARSASTCPPRDAHERAAAPFDHAMLVGAS